MTGHEKNKGTLISVPLASCMTALICVCLLLTGCGGSGKQKKQETQQSSQAKVESAEPESAGSQAAASKKKAGSAEKAAGTSESTAGSSESAGGSAEKAAGTSESAAGSSESAGGSSGNNAGPKENTAGAAQEELLQAVFFDVGKGDCILLSSGDCHVLIDAGYEETYKNVLKELSQRGISQLDAMVITHYDKDHVGGAAEIAEKLPVETFYLPDYEGDEDKCGDLMALISKKNLHAVRVKEEETISIGSARCQVDQALVSYDAELKNDNDASLIVEIFWGEDEWLLPGDIEKEAIGVWLEEHPEDTYDILKLPHHGQKEGNTKDLIRAVSPEIAVITDSTKNEASEKVLKKLEKQETQVYTSSRNGTIMITGNGKEEYKVTTQK